MAFKTPAHLNTSTESMIASRNRSPVLTCNDATTRQSRRQIILSVIDSVFDILLADEDEAWREEDVLMDSNLDLHTQTNELFLDSSVLGVEETGEEEDGSSCGNGSGGEAASQ
jgi:hypothetical protein